MEVPVQVCRLFLSILPLFYLPTPSYQATTSLKCYTCKSERSLEDCENQQIQQIGCKNSSMASSCYISQWTNDLGEKRFGKQCIATKKCTRLTICHPKSTHCQVHCCSTPLCNEKVSDSSSSIYTYPSVILIAMMFLINMKFNTDLFL